MANLAVATQAAEMQAEEADIALANTLDIPQTDAKHFIDKYFEELPGIKKFLHSLGNYGKKYGYIKTSISIN